MLLLVSGVKLSNTASAVVEVVVDERYFSVEVLPSYVIVFTTVAVPIVILTSPILCAIEKLGAAPLAFATWRSLLRNAVFWFVMLTVHPLITFAKNGPKGRRDRALRGCGSQGSNKSPPGNKAHRPAKPRRTRLRARFSRPGPSHRRVIKGRSKRTVPFQVVSKRPD